MANLRIEFYLGARASLGRAQQPLAEQPAGPCLRNWGGQPTPGVESRNRVRNYLWSFRRLVEFVKKYLLTHGNPEAGFWLLGSIREIAGRGRAMIYKVNSYRKYLFKQMQPGESFKLNDEDVRGAQKIAHYYRARCKRPFLIVIVKLDDGYHCRRLG